MVLKFFIIKFNILHKKPKVAIIIYQFKKYLNKWDLFKIKKYSCIILAVKIFFKIILKK